MNDDQLRAPAAKCKAMTEIISSAPICPVARTLQYIIRAATKLIYVSQLAAALLSLFLKEIGLGSKILRLLQRTLPNE